MDSKRRQSLEVAPLVLAFAMTLGGCDKSGSTPPGASSAAPTQSASASTGSEAAAAPSAEPSSKAGDDSLTVASFSITAFNPTKAGKPHVLAKIAEIVRAHDVLAVQGIKDADGKVPGMLLEAVNQGQSVKYGMEVSPLPEDAKTAVEQFGFYYRTSTIEKLGAGKLYEDPEEALTKAPFAGWFKAKQGSFSFVLINVSIRAKRAIKEVTELYRVNDWARKSFEGEDDFITLGDFNTSCQYANSTQLDELAFRGAGYRWIVPDTADTTTSSRLCAFDRIVMTQGAFNDYAGEWGITRAFEGKEVSERWPVWAKFHAAKE